MKTKKQAALILSVLFIISYANYSESCTRVVYQGPNNTILTARSMDWESEIPANLWIMPRGIERNGEAGVNSVKWKSKYGSIVTSSFNIASSDGMNEKGLVANMLWLVESKYPEFDKSQRGLSIALWAQYVLDNFATVEEAVNELSKREFSVVSTVIPGTDIFTTIHLSISDAKGDNAIIEYINGELTIHHSMEYTVMTNSPVFEKQLALDDYWKQIGGTVMLPGTNRAADRFARASFYITAIMQTDDIQKALAGVFGVIRNCSVPYGISTPNEPNISSTRWRTVSDQKNRVYYFENVLSPNTFWVDFTKADLSENAPVKKLMLENNEIYSGNALSSFVEAEQFKFAGLD
ncbi:MAG TPA: linear amide C-N hydrolase [Ignavibacteria bacterium]|nr:linear amide C-N hydrolase [Ignavibacteria bacterium]HRJ99017.1 linear amide C-N hydrolase [Ignavibacteria bacterium]